MRWALQAICSKRERMKSRPSETTKTIETIKLSETDKIEENHRTTANKIGDEMVEDGTTVEADKTLDRIISADGTPTRKITAKITPRKRKTDNRRELWVTEVLHTYSVCTN